MRPIHTLADLDAVEVVGAHHLAEALSYRADAGGRQRAA